MPGWLVKVHALVRGSETRTRVVTDECSDFLAAIHLNLDLAGFVVASLVETNHSAASQRSIFELAPTGGVRLSN